MAFLAAPSAAVAWTHPSVTRQHFHYSSKLFRVDIIHMSAGTWFLCSHAGKTFFMKHLGDGFLRPVNYDKGIGEGHVPQNVASERLFLFLFFCLIRFYVVWGIKKPMEKWKLFYFHRAFKIPVWILQDHVLNSTPRKKCPEFCHRTRATQYQQKRPHLPSHHCWVMPHDQQAIFIMHQI